MISLKNSILFTQNLEETGQTLWIKIKYLILFYDPGLDVIERLEQTNATKQSSENVEVYKLNGQMRIKT